MGDEPVHCRWTRKTGHKGNRESYFVAKQSVAGSCFVFMWRKHDQSPNCFIFVRFISKTMCRTSVQLLLVHHVTITYRRCGCFSKASYERKQIKCFERNYVKLHGWWTKIKLHFFPVGTKDDSCLLSLLDSPGKVNFPFIYRTENFPSRSSLKAVVCGNSWNKHFYNKVLQSVA